MKSGWRELKKDGAKFFYRGVYFMSELLMGRKAPEFSAKAVVKGEIVEQFSLKDLFR